MPQIFFLKSTLKVTIFQVNLVFFLKENKLKTIKDQLFAKIFKMYAPSACLFIEGIDFSKLCGAAVEVRKGRRFPISGLYHPTRALS